MIDIGNAYLNALCPEKVYTWCGPEFGDKEGMFAVIHKAIYGLKALLMHFTICLVAS